MSEYRQFIFKSYEFDTDAKLLTLRYSLDNELNFAETYLFECEPVAYQPEALDKAIQTLFFMAGVSYYKTYLPPEIVVEMGQLDGPTASFLSKTWQKGLGEFFYTNNLDPHTPIKFPVSAAVTEPIPVIHSEGQLIGIGGGKDSLVSVELLKQQPKVATWAVGHRDKLEPLIERIGLPHFWVERKWDAQLLELKNTPGAFNGHIPISAIIACVGTIVAILTGYHDIVVSNESSASEPNLHYQGEAINHQYSKSLEFEKDFQHHLGRTFGNTLNYYSFLRPLSELHIAELFAKTGFEKYKQLFVSCNKAYTHPGHELFWCGECPKCAFVFLALTPFVERAELEQMWGGKNLLLEPSLESTYRQLLGIQGDKPLECVGEIKESRAAMHLAQKMYPELKKYEFELPADYDYKALAPHAMPADMFALLRQKLAEL